MNILKSVKNYKLTFSVIHFDGEDIYRLGANEKYIIRIANKPGDTALVEEESNTADFDFVHGLSTGTYCFSLYLSSSDGVEVISPVTDENNAVQNIIIITDDIERSDDNE